MYKELSNKINKIFTDSNLNESQKSYLIFFLNKTIISGFNLDIDIQNILNIFNEYTKISYGYYPKGDDKIIRTGIEEYSKMIEELLVKI
jgi:hypothetical protein